MCLCSPGSEAVDWLLKWSFASHRADAVMLCEELLRLAHIQPIKSQLGRKNNDVVPEMPKHKFIDLPDMFYRFVSINFVLWWW